MIRYIALLAVLVVLSTFFAFYPLAETSSQVANVNRMACSNLANVNLDHPRYARCAAWANARANIQMNAANAAANMAANYVGDDYPDVPFSAKLPTCIDQPSGPDAAHFYFLNAQDIL